MTITRELLLNKLDLARQEIAKGELPSTINVVAERVSVDQIRNIECGICNTPVGKCLITLCDKGICDLTFGNEELLSLELVRILKKWRSAHSSRNDKAIQTLCNDIFNPQPNTKLRIVLCGTDFQVKVWRTLLLVPRGTVLSYRDLARLMNAQSATRAVASAIGRNEISIIIPCHRIIRNDGSTGEYRWGSEVKRKLIEIELLD